MSARPFVKFAGGKTKLLPEILPRLPERFGRYFEPFAGGAAVFFALRSSGRIARSEDATLADTNARLVNSFRGIQQHVDEVVHELKHMPHDAELFYRLRRWHADVTLKERPHDDCSTMGLQMLWDQDKRTAAVAAWFVYLNKNCFNGLYRVNQKTGMFNVPFGRFKTPPTVCDEENLRACAEALAGVHLQTVDFEFVCSLAERGDVVYADPPYVDVSETKTKSFVGYGAQPFTDEDQERLRDCAVRLKERGVCVLLSNADAPRVRELYGRGFVVESVSAPRSINSKGDRRGAVGEVLIR